FYDHPLFKKECLRIVVLARNQCELLRLTLPLIHDFHLGRVHIKYIGDFVYACAILSYEFNPVADRGTVQIVETDAGTFNAVARNRYVLHIGVVRPIHERDAVFHLFLGDGALKYRFIDAGGGCFQHPGHPFADIDTLTGLFSIIIPGFSTAAGDHRFEAADIDRRLSILIGFDDTVIDPFGENFAYTLPEEKDGSSNYHRDTEQ